MKLTVGLQLINQHGDMHQLREVWEEAESLGVDRIFVMDHFHAQEMNPEVLKSGVNHISTNSGKNFEATTLQAAIAATTTRMEIGCTVHAVGFRNPNLMADIARTIDHISGGRYILGMGTGYMQEEYDDYGYDNFGTAKSRMQDLAAAIPIIKARFEKLNPKPLRKIPILIASMSEKTGMRLVAEHADMWHIFGPTDKLRHKIEIFKKICEETGRDFSSVEILGTCNWELLPDNNLDVFHNELGIRHIDIMTRGPNFDLGQLRECLQWRKALAVSQRDVDGV